MTEHDPLAGFFWTRLSERAQAVVAANAEQIYQRLLRRGWWAVLNCDLAAAEWQRAFAAAGVPVHIVAGFYEPDHDEAVEPPLSADHTWLEVDGELVDPTAAQFVRLGPIDVRHYRRR